MRDWGMDLAESDFDAPHEWSVDSDLASDLPAVRAAAGLGYEPAHEAPLYCFLPAVWPNESRAWVRDIRIRHAQTSADGSPTGRVPWSTWDYFETEADTNGFLRDCGFPARPAGRLWLLRPPPGFASLDDVLRHLAKTAEAAGLELYAHPDFANHVERVVAQLFARGD